MRAAIQPFLAAVAFTALIALFAPACADEPERLEIPEEVQRAFDTSCVAAGCHDASTRAEGLSLAAEDSHRLGTKQSWQSDLPLVTLGDVERSYLAIKLLPDDQIPEGVMRFEDRMPKDGIGPEDIEPANVILAWIAGYGPSATGGGELTSTGTTAAESSDGTADGSGTSSTGSDPTDSGPTTITGGLPTNPACSVETVTDGAVSDPLDKGDEAGKIPLMVGVVLEERCGCHTLADPELNVEYPALAPPVDTLFLAHADFSRAVDGSTLGELMEEAVLTTLSMPPGSCPPIPDDDLALLEQWFLAGRPDGG
jgi:hypothetical protein